MKEGRKEGKYGRKEERKQGIEIEGKNERIEGSEVGRKKEGRNEGK